MRHLTRVVYAETIKQFKNKFHSSLVIFSMLLWPVLQFFTAYYSYKPFEGLALSKEIAKYVDDNKIFSFILFGYLGYMFFSCFVQSAWMFSRERVMGTLEAIYLTPCSRLGVMLGNAIGSFLESLWMFAIFSCGALIVFSDVQILNFWMLVVAILLLLIPSVIWGMFLNSVFLFSRDTGALFTFLEHPMENFTGVKIPFLSLPIWAKIIGGAFPLTWSLKAIRKIFMTSANLNDIKIELIILTFVCILLFVGTLLLLKIGEKYVKIKGTLDKF